MSTLAHKLQPEEREWCEPIRRLRLTLGLTQARLAQRLGDVTQAAVSQWEKGVREPTADNYIKLGKLAGGGERDYFWRKANFSPSEFLGGPRLPEVNLELSILTDPARGPKVMPDVVPVPLLKDAAAAGSPRAIDQSDIDRWLLVDATAAPHPQNTIAIRIVGGSMEPSLRDGFIVVIDTTERAPRELAGAMVAARDPSGGVTVKYLRLVHGEFMLVAEHTSVSYDPILLSHEPGWKILGKVLWWIGEPKRPK